MQLKIQFGRFKGKKLFYPVDYEARPTLARSRDVVFNWLGDLNGDRCLDLFAGTGVLGLEALSSGAKSVDFVDIKKRHLSQISRHLADLTCCKKQFTLSDIGAQAWLKKSSIPYDIIFVDPPFERKMYNQVLDWLRLSQAVCEKTLLYIEAPAGLEFDKSWQIIKEKKIAQVRIYLIKKL